MQRKWDLKWSSIRMGRRKSGGNYFGGKTIKMQKSSGEQAMSEGKMSPEVSRNTKRERS